MMSGWWWCLFYFVRFYFHLKRFVSLLYTTNIYRPNIINTEAKMSNIVCETHETKQSKKNIFRGGPGFHFYFLLVRRKPNIFYFILFFCYRRTHTHAIWFDFFMAKNSQQIQWIKIDLIKLDKCTTHTHIMKWNYSGTDAI